MTQKHMSPSTWAPKWSPTLLSSPAPSPKPSKSLPPTPVLETQDASVGQVVDQRNVNNLPLNGRNFTFLAQLAAGVNTPQADTRGNAATGAFSANGNRPAQNNYLLDGIDNNSDTVDFLNGTNFVVLPPVDADRRIQGTDFELQRRIWAFGRRGSQRHDQVGHQQLPRRRRGNSSATTSSTPPTFSKTLAASPRANFVRTSSALPPAVR